MDFLYDTLQHPRFRGLYLNQSEESILKKIEINKKYYIEKGFNITVNKTFFLNIWMKQIHVFGEEYHFLNEV